MSTSEGILPTVLSFIISPYLKSLSKASPLEPHRVNTILREPEIWRKAQGKRPDRRDWRES